MLHNTVALILITFMLQITCEKMKKLDTFASCNCAKISLLHEFLGVAFSLITIMLQTNFLFWEFFGLLAPLDKSFKCCRAVGHKDAVESTIFRYFD